MKTVNKICQILAIVFGAAALILFFAPFASIATENATYDFVGSQLAFRAKIPGTDLSIAHSADIWFCFFLSLAAVALSALTFKFKGARWAAPAVAVVDAVYMLVIALSNPWKFVDTRPIPATNVTYGFAPLLIAVAACLAFVFGVVYLLIDDYLIATASKGKLTIPKRLVRFLRDYKSEIKKIVWPGPREVVKNTAVVLVISLLVGIFIWVLDFGIAQLLEFVTGRA